MKVELYYWNLWSLSLQKLKYLESFKITRLAELFFFLDKVNNIINIGNERRYY